MINMWPPHLCLYTYHPICVPIYTCIFPALWGDTRVLLYVSLVFLHLVSNFRRYTLCNPITVVILLLCVGCICIYFSDIPFNCPLMHHTCFQFRLPGTMLTALGTIYFDMELYCTVINISFAICFTCIYLYICVILLVRYAFTDYAFIFIPLFIFSYALSECGLFPGHR